MVTSGVLFAGFAFTMHGVPVLVYCLVVERDDHLTISEAKTNP